MKRALILLLVVGIGFGAAALLVSNRQAARRAAQQAALAQAKADRAAELERARKQAPQVPATVVAPAPPEPLLPESTAPTVASAVPAPLMQVSPPVRGRGPTPAPAGNAKPPRRGKPELQDPLARVALGLVGADAQAEAVWADAINNPDLPANERKDLIEDLNEEGLPSARNLTMDDLPLILSRIAVIEAHFPDAMDEVNHAAFLEAYKDLVNMAARLMQ